MACIMCFYWHSAASVSTRDRPAQTLVPKAGHRTENPH